MRIAFGIFLLSIATASRADAACWCGLGAGAPLRPTAAPILFVGRVLAIDSLARERRVRFVTDSSWRGPLPDTLTVVAGDDAPCAYFLPGQSYVVGAVATPGTLRLPRCADAWAVSSWVQQRLSEVGPAVWRAPPFGRRLLDQGAVQIGQRAPPVRDSLEVLLSFGADTVEFTIADQPLPRQPRRVVEKRFVRLPPGLYQFRIRWSDATITESYVDLSCERHAPGATCYLIRFLDRPA
ncbi:MAG: hypothetical protein IPK85_08985 [Gemmatimonadetes bacterium]|nr:hypothetical protein [Gemmatimonadota bacterium]